MSSLNYLTTDRPALYAKAEYRLASYAKALLADEAGGGEESTWDRLTLDLLTGLDVVHGALSPRDDASVVAALNTFSTLAVLLLISGCIDTTSRTSQLMLGLTR